MLTQNDQHGVKRQTVLSEQNGQDLSSLLKKMRTSEPQAGGEDAGKSEAAVRARGRPRGSFKYHPMLPMPRSPSAVSRLSAESTSESESQGRKKKVGGTKMKPLEPRGAEETDEDFAKRVMEYEARKLRNFYGREYRMRRKLHKQLLSAQRELMPAGGSESETPNPPADPTLNNLPVDLSIKPDPDQLPVEQPTLEQPPTPSLHSQSLASEGGSETEKKFIPGIAARPLEPRKPDETDEQFAKRVAEFEARMMRNLYNREYRKKRKLAKMAANGETTSNKDETSQGKTEEPGVSQEQQPGVSQELPPEVKQETPPVPQPPAEVNAELQLTAEMSETSETDVKKRPGVRSDPLVPQQAGESDFDFAERKRVWEIKEKKNEHNRLKRAQKRAEEVKKYLEMNPNATSVENVQHISKSLPFVPQRDGETDESFSERKRIWEIKEKRNAQCRLKRAQKRAEELKKRQEMDTAIIVPHVPEPEFTVKSLKELSQKALGESLNKVKAPPRSDNILIQLLEKTPKKLEAPKMERSETPQKPETTPSPMKYDPSLSKEEIEVLRRERRNAQCRARRAKKRADEEAKRAELLRTIAEQQPPIVNPVQPEPENPEQPSTSQTIIEPPKKVEELPKVLKKRGRKPKLRPTISESSSTDEQSSTSTPGKPRRTSMFPKPIQEPSESNSAFKRRLIKWDEDYRAFKCDRERERRRLLKERQKQLELESEVNSEDEKSEEDFRDRCRLRSEQLKKQKELAPPEPQPEQQVTIETTPETTQNDVIDIDDANNSEIETPIKCGTENTDSCDDVVLVSSQEPKGMKGKKRETRVWSEHFLADFEPKVIEDVKSDNKTPGE